MFPYVKWLGLPLHLRRDIATQFGVNKTMPTHVQDNRVVSDGYKLEDLDAALTEDNIRLFLESSEQDTLMLWDELIGRFEPQEVLIIEKVAAPVSQEKTVADSMATPEHTKVIPPKKRGRPAKPK